MDTIQDSQESVLTLDTGASEGVIKTIMDEGGGGGEEDSVEGSEAGVVGILIPGEVDH